MADVTLAYYYGPVESLPVARQKAGFYSAFSSNKAW